MDFNNEHNSFLGILIFALRYYLIAGIAYFVFYVWKKNKFSAIKLNPRYPTSKQLKTEVFYSTVTLLIYTVGPVLLFYWHNKGLTTIYTDVETFGYLYFCTSILVMVVLHDTYFYWTHKLMHQLPFLYRYHKIHHRSHNPNPWSSFSFHPVEAIISLGIIPVIIFIVPVHKWALIIFYTIMVLNNVSIHLGYKIIGSKIQNTVQDHHLHHKKGRCNYGLYFSFWDRVMGTYE